MRKSVVGLILFMLSAPLLADKKLDDRMMHAASILQEIRGPLEEEPPGVLTEAYAVAIFPEFLKVGLLGGVKHGRGVLATRLASGTWSKPAFVRITSGSLGLQFGVTISQLLIVFKDPKAVEAISGGQFSMGADAGYAAGELGGSAGAGTDHQLENKIVAMARSKGLFAGVALEGGVLRIEKDSNVEFYNDAIGLDGRKLLQDTEVELPTVAQHFIIVLDESVPPLSPEASPVSWGKKGLDELRREAGEEGRRMAESSATDADGQGAEGHSQAESTSTDGIVDPGQPPSQAIASAPGLSTPGGASQGSWVTPDGTELPSGNTTQAASGSTGGPGTRGFSNETASAATWVSEEDANLAPIEETEEQERSGGSGLAGKIVGKVTEAVWDGAKELALESIRSKPEVQGAKLAAKVGGELVDGVGSGSREPPRKPTEPPIATAANNGEWVETLETQADLAGAPASVPASAPASAPAPAGQPDYQLASRAPDSLPAIANAPSTDFTGPPSPSEWPEEWRRDDILGGVCAPGS